MSDPRQTPPEAPPASARRSAWQFLLGVVVVLLVLDLVVALALRGSPREPVTPDGAGAVNLYLEEVVAHARVEAQIQRDPSGPGPGAGAGAGLGAQAGDWLLIGDSVLVGDTGKAELPSWAEHRLVDYMAEEASPESGLRLHQLAYSGLLPVDMALLVEALDRADPEGEISLLVELSPRYFSAAYAEQVEHSRPWFAALGDDQGLHGRATEALDWLTAHTPLVRHRDRFRTGREESSAPLDPVALDGAEGGAASGSDAEGGGVGELEALARLSVHYRDLDLGTESVQVEALLGVVARCRAAGRRVVFVATPIEDEFMASVQTPREQGEYLARLDGLLEPDGERVQLSPMDHPLFASPLFWDHVHLRPEGHRLMAINLLLDMGVRVGQVPTLEEQIRRVGVDASLVARIEVGYSDGASWQAQFDRPRSLTFVPERGELVIADSGNHVLRVLHGDQGVVSTLAGVGGEPGSQDGIGAEARLNQPDSLAVLGTRAYFSDRRGRALRWVELGGDSDAVHPDTVRGGVHTVALSELASSWRIVDIQAYAHGSDSDSDSGPAGSLALIQTQLRRTQVSIFDPGAGPGEGAVKVWVVGSSQPQSRVVALTSDPEGTLYLGTAAGQIWSLDPSLGEALSQGKATPVDIATEAGRGRLKLVYENLGEHVLPQGKNDFFPYAFDHIALTKIVGLEYVERYGGLLVQDQTRHPKQGGYKKKVTERVHLRYLDLEHELVYPWLKPLVAGTGYFYRNEKTGGFSSYYHDGAMALDQRTATLYYIEEGRSRLLRLADGLLGVAQIGNVNFKALGFRELLVTYAARRAYAAFRPDRFFARDTYTGLLLCSSMMAMSDVGGQYSMGRGLGARLDRGLRLRQGQRLELFQRTVPGGALVKQIAALETFLESGGRPDIILVESNASIFLPEDADEAFMVEQLDALVELAEHTDAALIFIDTSPYISRHRAALRPILPRVVQFLALVEGQGLPVIDVGDRMLDRHLEVSPFTSPPAGRLHMTPWAIDAVTAEVATRLAPLVEARLRGRTPARVVEEEGGRPQSRRRGAALAKVFAEREFDWDSSLPRIPAAARQSQFASGVVAVFVDLGQLPEDLPAESQAELEALALACVYELSVRQHDGARRAVLDLGRFTRYDEYGLGVGEGADVALHLELDHAALSALADAFMER